MLRQNFKKLILFVLVMAVFSCHFLIAKPASARTGVTIEDCNIKVTIYLAFAFLDDVSWANADQLMAIWETGIEDTWNKPGFTYGFCECPVTFDVVVSKLPKGQDCRQAPWSETAPQPGRPRRRRPRRCTVRRPRLFRSKAPWPWERES